MAGSDQKKQFSRSLNQLAVQRATDAIGLLGKSLPCSVVSVLSSNMVTVRFAVNAPFPLPDVSIPVGSSEYVRLPIQPGCTGLAVAADVKLGGITGLGSGVPDLTAPANLTALVFFPIGKTTFSGQPINELVLYGEPSVQIQDKTIASTIKVDTSGITLASHGHTITITSAGVTIDGIVFGTHQHGGVSTGSGVTEGPQA